MAFVVVILVKLTLDNNEIEELKQYFFRKVGELY